MRETNLRKTTVNGVLWSTLERFSVQGVQFVFMLIMARLLVPSDYGIIAMLNIFLAIAQSLIDCGFSDALIRKIDRSVADSSTVFYFNIVVSGLLSLILFIVAPRVADFYTTPQLCPVMRVVCLSIIINSFAVVQRALFVSNVDFKSQAKASLIAAFISGITGVYLAYINFGVWALVAQALLSTILNTLLLWFMSSWRPKWLYSWESFHELFIFGSKMMMSGLINTIYINIYPIIIGKIFSAEQLGYYSRAQQFADLPSSNITNILKRVTYPVMCKVQDDQELLLNTYCRLIRMSCFVVFPLMLGLSALAEPFIVVVLGEKWQSSAHLLQIICFAMMLYPVHSLNLNLLQTKGRADLILNIEVIKKILGVVLIACTAPLGLEAMCYGMVFNSVLSLFINTYYTGKFLNFGICDQMKEIVPSLFLSLIMLGAIHITVISISNPLFSLFVGWLVAVCIYLVIALLTCNKSMRELIHLLKNRK